MRSHKALLAILLVVAVQADYVLGQDVCPGSCDLREVTPVCGADGVTYQSACLAICQEIAVARNGACKARDATSFAPARAGGDIDTAGEASTKVDVFAMNRFKQEGFVFVGQGQSDPDFKVTPRQAKGRPRRRSAPLNPSATRIVFETGHIYRTAASTGDILAQALAPMMAAADAAPIAYDPSALPPVTTASVNSTNTTAGPSAADITPADAAAAGVPSEPVVEESGLLGALGRKLKGILGPDGRTRVTAVTSYPWRAIGWLQTGCSATLVTPTSILTAAHCVHGGKGGSWAGWDRVVFWPGADGANRPYAQSGAVWMTTYTEWITNGCPNACPVEQFFYDWAVVRLAEPVGSTNGWLGMTPSDTFSNIAFTTAGYPGDKPYPTMWTQTCMVSDSNPNDFLTTVTATTGGCDVVGGQSGSSLWQTSTQSIRAVVSHGSDTTSGFVQLTTPRFWDMISWAGGMYSRWNDAGANDAYRSIYMDRHDLSMCGNPTAMSSFKMEMRYDGAAQMRFTYQCDGYRGISGNPTVVRYATTANDWGSGNVIFLDRHDVRCGANQVLRRWRLFRPSSTRISIEYFCVPATVNTATCENLFTPWNSNGNGQANFLDRHSVTCPTGKALTRWKLETDNPNSQMRIAFTCCRN